VSLGLQFLIAKQITKSEIASKGCKEMKQQLEKTILELRSAHEVISLLLEVGSLMHSGCESRSGHMLLHHDIPA